MLNLLYGPAGSGKSTRIYERIIRDLRDGEKPILIVPDQYLLNAESNFASFADDVPTFDLEILSFRRLANHVFRELGGLSFSDIDDSGKLLIMWRVLREVSPFLKAYGNIDKSISSFAELMLGTVTELKQFSITPKALDIASKKLKDTHGDLSNKLHDISFIYGTFQSFLSKEYNDPSDELTRLADTLDNTGFFSDNKVYFDSFDGFTPQQLSVIRCIAKQAKNVTFSLCFDPSDNSGIFATTEKTYKNLKKIALSLSLNVNEECLGESKTFISEDISYVCKNLWKHDVAGDSYDKDNSHVNTILCHDKYEECEAVVVQILKKVRDDGARYKDIVIIARDISSYEGIIDSLFDNNGIPYHMSKRTDISTKPIFKLILSALEIHNKNWKYSDVISFLKTGLAGISYDDIDILENYVSAWNINGRRWTDGIDWHMNPDGYTEKITPEGSFIINRANAVREMFVPHLIKFFESIGNTTVEEVTRALYDFLNDLNIKEQIENKASEYRLNGDIDEEKELVQLWNILINTLDTMVQLAGDMKINGEEYVTLISMILGKINIGTIPATIDQVILGSASSLRTNSVPHVFMLGVNEGVFPMASEENLLFSDNEKSILKTVDIDFLPLTDEQSADELYWFYKSISRAKETLTVTYCDSDLKGESKKISVAGSRIGYLLNKQPIKYADVPMIDKVEGRSIAIKTFALNRENELGQALYSYFEKDRQMADDINAFDVPLAAGVSDIDEKLAREIYRGDIQTSQSRIENYVNCSFDYHCKHILKLAEKKTAEFQFNDIGNFIHTILERFMAAITDEEGFHADIEDAEVVKLVDGVVEEYISSIFGDVKGQNARLLQLVNRLRRTTLLLVRNILAEFKQSDFVPTFFELPIFKDNEKGILPYEIELDDGSKLCMRGYIDRVDTYKKGKDVYIRIVDYKSGDKKFSFKDVEKGLNIQMLLYLFAVWNTKEKWFKEKIKCEGDILPAGILYYVAKAPLLDVNSEEELDSLYDNALNKIGKSGLLIRDIDVLKAMDKNMKGLYIPFKTNKDGSLAKSDYLLTVEEFGNLANRIDGILKNIGTNIKAGKVEAKPIDDDPQKSPCRYCRMKPICRRCEKGEE